jgi:protein TonB
VGVRGGIGSGDAGGIGSGSGSGYGPGRGGGSGGGIYTVGNGISAPLAIYTPEPEYSDEARKAKFQGVVTLLAVVGPDGTPKNLQVARSLGMGLDDKAIAAVKTWRFQPGMKDGHPVAVQISIEVNFHLF